MPWAGYRLPDRSAGPRESADDAAASPAPMPFDDHQRPVPVAGRQEPIRKCSGAGAVHGRRQRRLRAAHKVLGIRGPPELEQNEGMFLVQQRRERALRVGIRIERCRALGSISPRSATAQAFTSGVRKLKISTLALAVKPAQRAFRMSVLDFFADKKKSRINRAAALPGPNGTKCKSKLDIVRHPVRLAQRLLVATSICPGSALLKRCRSSWAARAWSPLIRCSSRAST